MTLLIKSDVPGSTAQIHAQAFLDKPFAKVAKKDWGTSDAYADNTGWSLLGAMYGGSHTGLLVSPVTALQCGAVWGCVRMLVDGISKLPLKMYRLEDDIWIEELDDQRAKLMRYPNKRMTAADFKRHIVMSMLLVGNAFNVILRDRSGVPTDIIPCIPSTVSITENGTGDLFYTAFNRMFPKTLKNRIHEEDIAHIRAYMSLDGGIRGVSPVQVCSEVLGLGIATQQLAATMFKNGNSLMGYLTTKESGIPDEIVKQIANGWAERQRGIKNAYTTPVLQAGFNYNPIEQDLAKLQLVEARRRIVEEVAMCFGIPVSKLGTNDKGGYNSIDAQQQDYIDSSLIPLTDPIEEELNKKLLFEEEYGKFRFAFDFSALEKGDLKTQTDRFHILLNDGVLTVNMVLKALNLPAIGPEGDIRTKPTNTGVLGNVQGMPIWQIQAPEKTTETIQEPSKPDDNENEKE